MAADPTGRPPFPVSRRQDACSRFLWKLEMENLQMLLDNKERLAALRHDWQTLRRYEKRFANHLKVRGLDLAQEVIAASQKQPREGDDVVQEPAGPRQHPAGGRQLGNLHPAQGRGVEDENPVVAAWNHHDV